MKIVINQCFGGFSLSPAAVRRLAELDGRRCYFFRLDYAKDTYIPMPEAEADNGLFWNAFDIPNPNEAIGKSFRDGEGSYKKFNEIYEKHSLPARIDDRSDPKLIQVIEELGSGHRTGASGRCANLQIVEIPDDVKYQIDEYDGWESIHEEHRSWG